MLFNTYSTGVFDFDIKNRKYKKFKDTEKVSFLAY